MRHRSNRPNRKYASIPNAAMRDEHLSIEARGMLALLMTYSDTWTFRRSHLMQVAGVGRDKFQRLMRELIEAGYVRRVPVREDGGKVRGSEWLITDEPDREPDNQAVGSTESLKNRSPVSPATGKSGPLRRSSNKKIKGGKVTPPPSFETWQPENALTAWAKGEGFTDRDIEEETRKWIKHWQELGTSPPAPLGKSWKGWMLIELNYRAKQSQRPTAPKKPGSSALEMAKRSEARRQAELEAWQAELRALQAERETKEEVNEQ